MVQERENDVTDFTALLFYLLFVHEEVMSCKGLVLFAVLTK